MNTIPTAISRERAPFAAVLHFKPSSLYQGKFKSFAFRSDDLSPPETPPAQQYPFLENYILSFLKGSFWDAALFTNVGGLPAKVAQVSRNLVWKHNHLKFMIDNRPFLDLSFLEHTYSPTFEDQIWRSFQQPTLPIAAVDELYKQTFNL